MDLFTFAIAEGHQYTQPVEWTCTSLHDASPQQHDFVNCGVYMLFGIFCTLLNMDLKSVIFPNSTQMRDRLTLCLATSVDIVAINAAGGASGGSGRSGGSGGSSGVEEKPQSTRFDVILFTPIGVMKEGAYAAKPKFDAVDSGGGHRDTGSVSYHAFLPVRVDHKDVPHATKSDRIELTVLTVQDLYVYSRTVRSRPFDDTGPARQLIRETIQEHGLNDSDQAFYRAVPLKPPCGKQSIRSKRAHGAQKEEEGPVDESSTTALPSPAHSVSACTASRA